MNCKYCSRYEAKLGLTKLNFYPISSSVVIDLIHILVSKLELKPSIYLKDYETYSPLVFVSCLIPVELEKLKNLEYIDFHNNRLKPNNQEFQLPNQGSGVKISF